MTLVASVPWFSIQHNVKTEMLYVYTCMLLAYTVCAVVADIEISAATSGPASCLCRNRFVLSLQVVG